MPTFHIVIKKEIIEVGPIHSIKVRDRANCYIIAKFL